VNQAVDEQLAGEEPLYNIGVVSRMTGIPVATLRVWERRYDFPDSARTAGGHRLYSERQVMALRWVKAQVDRGMQARQAVRALRALERQGRFPEPLPGAAAATPPSTNHVALNALREGFAHALRAHDAPQAEDLLAQALALYPPEALILDVVIPILDEVGQAYAVGQIHVATEHFISQFWRNHLVTWMLSGPPSLAVRPTVLACAPDEWHELSLMMLGVLLRRRRWPVAYLGQALPLPDLAAFVRDLQPPAVVLVAMREETAQALIDWPRWLPEAARTGRPLVVYGGRIFTHQPEWRARVPGVFLGATLGEGVETLERLLQETTRALAVS